MDKQCKKCEGALTLISKVRELLEPDFDGMSDGQMADWQGEEASGDYSNHGVNIFTYKCKKCGDYREIIE